MCIYLFIYLYNLLDRSSVSIFLLSHGSEFFLCGPLVLVGFRGLPIDVDLELSEFCPRRAVHH